MNQFPLKAALCGRISTLLLLSFCGLVSIRHWVSSYVLSDCPLNTAPSMIEHMHKETNICLNILDIVTSPVEGLAETRAT
jgi:hypothetical protein